jgi:hypothetical protein
MRFSIVSIFALATAVAATEGYWTVNVSEHILEEGKVQYVNAKYHSDEYPDGLRNSCYMSSAEPVGKNCDRDGFWYEYDGTSKSTNTKSRIENKGCKLTHNSPHPPAGCPAAGPPHSLR